jgi:hypothetical protein
MNMATHRRRRRHHKKAAHCKVVSVGGHRRKMCWSAKGKITSNRPAHSRRRRRHHKR